MSSDNHVDVLLQAIFVLGQRVEAAAQDVAEIKKMSSSLMHRKGMVHHH